MPNTTNFSWVMPTVGGSTDTWGTELNSMFQAMDTSVWAIKGTADAALPKAGGTMTGAITLNADPGSALHAATKQYVDTFLSKSGGTMTGTLVAKKAYTPPPSTINPDTGTLTINCNDSNVFDVVLNGNVSTFTISNPVAGQTINVFLKQDATGSRTVAWPASFKWVGAAPVVSTASNAMDLLVATYFGTSWYAQLQKGWA